MCTVNFDVNCWTFGWMMVFFGSFTSKLPHAKTFTIVGTIGVVMGAVYILIMIQKIFLGKAKEKHEHPLHEPSVREWVMLAPLAVMSLVIGIYPKVAIDIIQPNVMQFTSKFTPHIEQAAAKAAADAAKKDSGKTEEEKK